MIDEINFLHKFLIANDTTELSIIFMDFRVHGETAAVFQSKKKIEFRVSPSDIEGNNGECDVTAHSTNATANTYILPQSAHCHFCWSFFFWSSWVRQCALNSCKSKNSR